MNIFEAVEAGKGKALYRGRDFLKVCFDPLTNQFYWDDNKDTYISFEDLKRNDWMPYVPSEERKIEGMVELRNSVSGKPYVPRGTCSNCGQPIPPQKEKHKEVLEDVVWRRNAPAEVVYPYFYKNQGIFERLFRQTTKMTLEWEE